MALPLYKTYVFQDKDPVIDMLRTAADKSEKSDTQICRDAGLSASTPHGWFYGRTKRPQHATAAAYAGALGLKFKLVKI